MNIIRGKRAGFCMGVGLALKKLDEAIKRYPLKKNIYPGTNNTQSTGGGYIFEKGSGPNRRCIKYWAR